MTGWYVLFNNLSLRVGLKNNFVNSKDLKDLETLHRNAPCNDSQQRVKAVINNVAPKSSEFAHGLFQLRKAIS